jgi:hypothetical protein
MEKSKRAKDILIRNAMDGGPMIKGDIRKNRARGDACRAQRSAEKFPKNSLDNCPQKFFLRPETKISTR